MRREPRCAVVYEVSLERYPFRGAPHLDTRVAVTGATVQGPVGAAVDPTVVKREMLGVAGVSGVSPVIQDDARTESHGDEPEILRPSQLRSPDYRRRRIAGTAHGHPAGAKLRVMDLRVCPAGQVDHGSGAGSLQGVLQRCPALRRHRDRRPVQGQDCAVHARPAAVISGDGHPSRKLAPVHPRFGRGLGVGAPGQRHKHAYDADPKPARSDDGRFEAHGFETRQDGLPSSAAATAVPLAALQFRSPGQHQSADEVASHQILKEPPALSRYSLPHGARRVCVGSTAEPPEPRSISSERSESSWKTDRSVAVFGRDGTSCWSR